MALRIGSGDLTKESRLLPNDTANLTAAMMSMQANLTKVVSGEHHGSESVVNASSEIAQADNDISVLTERQASALEKTSSSRADLGHIVKWNAATANQASFLASRASDVALQGGTIIGQVLQTMKGIDVSSQKIADIIGVIDGTAFQTNILALNAVLEAARAGEQGCGFAVVASELLALTGRSAAAAKEINLLIEVSVSQVAQGNRLVGQAGETMNHAVSAISGVTGIVTEIITASAAQSEGVAQICEAVMKMDQATQQNAAFVEQMAAAACSLQSQTNELVGTVEQFKISGSHLVASPSPLLRLSR